MSDFFYKQGVHVLCKHELHTLESFCVVVWTQWGYLAATPALPAINHFFSNDISPETGGPSTGVARR